MSSRRSLRHTSRKTYTDDAFAEIPDLNDDLPPLVAEDEGSEDDFVIEADSGNDSAKDDVGLEDASSSDGDASAETEAEDDSTPQSRTLPAHKVKKAAATPLTDQRGRDKRPKYANNGEQLFFRGVDESSFSTSGKGNRRVLSYGASVKDFLTVESAIARWGQFSVLPIRKETRHTGGYKRPFLSDEATFRKHILHNWQWYSPDLFSSQQEVELRKEDVHSFLPAQDRTFLYGAIGDPKVLHLGACKSRDTKDAWTDSKSRRSALLLNAGDRVQSLEWLPHQNGDSQYLAVSTLPEHNPDHKPLRAKRAPAFTPSKSYPTALQIWRIRANEKLLPTDAKLHTLLCTEFGNMKQFRFCPFDKEQNTPLLLAGIWTDGVLRIIKLDIKDSEELVITQIRETSLSWKPPDTVFTCLAWQTPRTIVAGCANGNLAVLNLDQNERPAKYSSIAASYILSITSCQPTHPNLVLTSSMEGITRMTDTSEAAMASPIATVCANRNRSIIVNLVWHDYVQAAMFADDSFHVKAQLARRVFSIISTARLKSTITSVAVSACHPFVLAGTACGQVTSFNPMPKVAIVKAQVFQQIWFMHEWRRPTAEEQSQGKFPIGLSRFVEGLKPDRGLFFASAETNATHSSILTIYEKESAVTALAWNPNLHVGGWAAAGMGDGLVRIDDISL